MPASAANDERNRSALSLRIEGLTYRQIAERLGVAVSRAHELVKREAAETLPDDAAVADWRALMMSRLEAMNVAVWDRACAGDIPSVLTVLRIAAAQSRLLGLDRAPEPAQTPRQPIIVTLVGADGEPDTVITNGVRSEGPRDALDVDGEPI